jgi:hypothetical protein
LKDLVSEELCSQAASEVYFGKFLSSKRHNSHKIQAIKLKNFPNYTSEAAVQHSSSETTEQNFMKLGR